MSSRHRPAANQPEEKGERKRRPLTRCGKASPVLRAAVTGKQSSPGRGPGCQSRPRASQRALRLLPPPHPPPDTPKPRAWLDIRRGLLLASLPCPPGALSPRGLCSPSGVTGSGREAADPGEFGLRHSTRPYQPDMLLAVWPRAGHLPSLSLPLLWKWRWEDCTGPFLPWPVGPAD